MEREHVPQQVKYMSQVSFGKLEDIKEELRLSKEKKFKEQQLEEQNQIQEQERQYREEEEQVKKFQTEEAEREALLNEKKSQIYFRYLHDLEKYGLISRSWINNPINNSTLVSYEKEVHLSSDDLAGFNLEHTAGEDFLPDLSYFVNMYYKDRRRLLKGQPTIYFNMKWDIENWSKLSKSSQEAQYRYNKEIYRH